MVVVGGGNAGLVAAISARHVAQSVLVLERTPTWRRGGNSQHTRNLRYAHAAGEPYTTGEAYPPEELLADLQRVGGGHNAQLADLIVEQADQIAYSFVDSRRIDGFLTSRYRPYEGNSVEEVAQQMELDPEVVGQTVREFNAAVVPGGRFDPATLDACARVQMGNGRSVDNLFAAGEIMSGNTLWSGYLGGFGLTIGTVFGRIAGTHAGQYARA